MPQNPRVPVLAVRFVGERRSAQIARSLVDEPQQAPDPAGDRWSPRAPTGVPGLVDAPGS
ncbi:hypothetical protein GCM10009687_53340 [Asanoa iriomotensis]|uniref:Uncharacterized protein n=1 Tax=Asanoa iriomotensis TaxID=234613 RepID=A0ABQ4BWV4_9ACTN|nr:hypothetical protein Air01nite_06300 [Asanoa iriomotensis]